MFATETFSGPAPGMSNADANPESASHPADIINIADAAARVFASLTGGLYWDEQALQVRPELAGIGDEHIDYVMEGCWDHGLYTDENLDPRTPEGRDVIAAWTQMRAEVCKEILLKLNIQNDHVRAHRLIACSEFELKPALGSYWTHDYANWPDPYAPWAEGGRDAPTLVIEAMVPVCAIDWQTSCMALMDWYCGDSESELRLKPGHPVRLTSCMRLQCETPVAIPDLLYTT